MKPWILILLYSCNNLFLVVPGRVCIPIDPKDCEEFDPTTVPTLSEVSILYITEFSYFIYVTLSEGAVWIVEYPCSKSLFSF